MPPSHRARLPRAAAVFFLAVSLAVAPERTRAASHFVRVFPVQASFQVMGPHEPPERQTVRFLTARADVFGIRDVARELTLPRERTDAYGWRHLDYRQIHHGVPVFGARLRAHLDPAGALRTVNGTFVAGIAVDPTPALPPDAASAAAVASAAARSGRTGLTAGPSRLLVFREGLLRGEPGPDHLAWEVEVGNGSDVRELIYVDAHDGQVVYRLQGIHDALDRRVFIGSLGGVLAWSEGEPLPTADPDVTNIATYTGDTYRFFLNAFGRDSYDGLGSTMRSVRLNNGPSCPNAFASGTTTMFCPGVTWNDVVAHEWTHVHTAQLHNLIYEDQPGALNEAYSDIFGEAVDRVNGPGVVDVPRTVERCSAVGSAAVAVEVHAPTELAGSLPATAAQFGPRLNETGITGDVVLVDDGRGDARACGAGGIGNAAEVSGHIALVDRGDCFFVEKVVNAQAAGAVGVIVANNEAGLVSMGGTDASIAIPSVSITREDGTRLKASLPSPGVNVSTRMAGAPLEASGAWLVGEEVGGIRDLWNPPCFNHPGRVSDAARYVCDPDLDDGGVHINSGIPNHAFALLVDGGMYNGQTVTAIGLTKAAHVYFRAMSTYQTELTNFNDHATALEQSCADLIGIGLRDPASGATSELALTADDCAQVSAAMAAVEMRLPPCLPPGATTTTTTPGTASPTTTLPGGGGGPTLPSSPFLEGVLQTIAERLQATPRDQLRRRGLRVRLEAPPVAGKLRVEVTMARAGSIITVAKGRARVRRPRAFTLKLRVTRQGKRFFKGAEVARLTLEATFLAKGLTLGGRQEAVVTAVDGVVGR